jgi:Ca-activated chloride channel family protein
MPVSGSNPLAGFELADRLLKNAGYPSGEIFVLTDGFEHQDIVEIQDFIKDTKHRISILGVGTPEGAPIKQLSGELLKNARGSIIIPKLNDASLRQLAKSTGGAYTRITSTNIDVETLATQTTISYEAKKDDNQLHQGDQFKEFGPYLVWLILPFAAYAFRRGLVVCVVLGFSLTTSYPAHADWWQDMWQTKDQQAQKQFNTQNYTDAAATFNDPKWKGSSLYKSGDYEAALTEYQKSDDANGKYNQGNAHAQMQNFDEAIKAYEEALKQNPDMEDAKKNLDVIKKLKQQKEQQQQEKDGEDGDKQQDQQDKEGQQEGDQKPGEDGEPKEGENESESEQQENSEQDDPQPRPNDQSQKDAEKDSQSRQPQSEEDKDSEQEQQAQAEQQEGEEEEEQEGEQQAQQVQPTEPTNEEKEQMQEIQQLLRKIPDDPSILLRNKMRLEYQKRKQQQARPPGAKSW